VTVRTTPRAPRALADLKRAGYAVLVVSNQSGVSRGLTTLDAMLAVNETALRLLDPDRTLVDWVAICPHAPADRCGCRKPYPGGVRAVERKCSQALGAGWFVGDQLSDMECGRALGLRTVLVTTGHGGSTWGRLARADRELVDHWEATFADAVGRLVLRPAVTTQPARSHVGQQHVRRRPARTGEPSRHRPAH
jgi:D-glycero-D-manno-heptose 1,7-bisphosphate phosphatase